MMSEDLAMPWPKPTDDQSSGGWRVHVDFLAGVTHEGGEWTADLYLEQVEAVLTSPPVLAALAASAPSPAATGSEIVAWRCFDKIWGTYSVTDSKELAEMRAGFFPDAWEVTPLYPQAAPAAPDDAVSGPAAFHLRYALDLLEKAAEFIGELPATDEINTDEWVWQHQYAVFLDPASAHPSFAEHGKPEEHAALRDGGKSDG